MRLRHLPDLDEALRELTRAAAAFAVSLLVYPLWILSGLQHAYDCLLAALATSLVLFVQRVPTFTSIRELRIGALALPAVVTIAYVLVSRAIPWGKRLRQNGTAIAVIIATQAVGVAALLKLDSAQRLLAEKRWAVLLPWETRLLDGLVYLLVNLGPEAAIFVMMVLAAKWNLDVARWNREAVTNRQARLRAGRA